MNTQSYSVATIRAIIGLGNPGSAYHHHRHSIGARIVDELAKQHNATWNSSELMDYAEITVGADQKIYLIKPTTYMNNSGKVLPWLQKKGIKGENILVIHDELEKPFGSVTISWAGSHKGHNGLKSIIAGIGADFWRLKFGIGRPADKAEVPTYVLTPFSRQEEVELPGLIDKAVGLTISG